MERPSLLQRKCLKIICLVTTKLKHMTMKPVLHGVGMSCGDLEFTNSLIGGDSYFFLVPRFSI